MARNWSEVFAAAATAAVRNLDTDGVDYNDGLAWRCSRSSFAVMRTNLCEKARRAVKENECDCGPMIRFAMFWMVNRDAHDICNKNMSC